MNITGGTVGGLMLNNVMGKTTVNFSGGAVGNASKSVEAAIAEFVVDGTATLYATPNVDAKLMSLFFDKVNYVSEIPAAPAVELKMTLDKTDYTINGAKKTMDVAPIIRNSRTMLPVRYVAEALGATIAWDGATSTATLTTADTEVSPIVGSEKQSEDVVKFLLKEFEENPASIWESNMFGKSLHELVNEGLNAKLAHMPEDARMKLADTLQKIINDGSNGLICILL